jgi:hypothetical protein
VSDWSQDALGDLAQAISMLPPGWWWSGGICSVSCHASVGPDRASCDDGTLKAFDAGFHCDIDQLATLAQALEDCCAQAWEALDLRDAARHEALTERA